MRHKNTIEGRIQMIPGNSLTLTVLLGVVHSLVGAQHGKRMVGQSEGIDKYTLGFEKTELKTNMKKMRNDCFWSWLYLGLVVGV